MPHDGVSGKSASRIAAGPGGHGETIPALTPRTPRGHQFVIYGDSCSGVPGGRHEAGFAQVTHVVSCLRPRPEFILFPGDELIGLTADMAELRRQWAYWRAVEMAWAGREGIPVFHTTGNHTAYDNHSESVFREVLAHVPRNGPPGQEGLAYSVHHGDLLLACVNTTWSGLGGEGRVETAWLDRTLASADVRWKIVAGHQPAFPVNGFGGSYQRELAADNAEEFWAVLVKHGVLAYVCSHILAFDIQVHQGVLQLLSAGAGTTERMPAGVEYLHCVQAALDDKGLRYQVLDATGTIRERLSWPPRLPVSVTWAPLGTGTAPAECRSGDGEELEMICFRFTGIAPGPEGRAPQTLLHAWSPGPCLGPLWIGLQGAENRLCVVLSDAPEHSPHLWHGPVFESGEPFDFQLALHTSMGPGGILWRRDDDAPWSSLRAASPWGAERLEWPQLWTVGHARDRLDDRPFRGQALRAWWHRCSGPLVGDSHESQAALGSQPRTMGSVKEMRVA